MYFSQAQLKTIFQLQTLANNAMSTDWLTGPKNPYYRASFVEASEAIGDHIKFKWWKKEEMDFEQAVIELVDILHFSASDHIRYYYDQIASPKLSVLENLEKAIDIAVEQAYQENQTYAGYFIIELGSSDIRENYIDALEQYSKLCLQYKYADIVALYKVFNIFEVHANKIYNIYVGKNTLNLFRTANGQKQNKYIKIWNGKEDNFYLEQYLKDIGDNELNIDAFNAYLTETYSKIKQEN